MWHVCSNAETVEYLLTFPAVRTAIRNDAEINDNYELHEWHASFVKRTLVRFLVLDAWRLCSIYSMYSSSKYM